MYSRREDKCATPSMAVSTANHCMSALLMLGLLITVSLNLTVGQTGVCYGMLGNDLPSPEEVVRLYKQYNIQRMRIYDPDRRTLQALNGSDIELILGVPNIDLENLSSCQDNADSWIKDNVIDYPGVKITHIVIGNEVNPIKERNTSAYVPFVLPAMQYIYNAIRAAGLDAQVKVSTGIDTSVLEVSYPPADGVFRSDTTSYLDPIIQFLVTTDSPFFVSIYPYFAYISDPVNIKLGYALLQPNNGITLPDGTRYDNLFYAILDAMYAAVEKSIRAAGSPLQDAKTSTSPKIKGSETGWPSYGGESDSSDPVTSIKNARIYNNNVIRIVKKGTPKRPNQPIEAYIFAMFDENEKEGPETEKHFGIFRPDGTPKYKLIFS